MNEVKVFILAAGLGERLRPITDHIPKPLLPILSRPLVELILERVSSLPVTQIGINIHYKAEMIESWLRSSPYAEKITFFPENPVLGTGGALKNAATFLKGSVFLVHNSDIVSDIDLSLLVQKHCASGDMVTLATHEHPEFSSLWIGDDGYLLTVGAQPAEENFRIRSVAFTGIAVYDPSFLDILPDGNSGVVDSWLTALSAGFRIGTFDCTGHYWSDIGTPDAYARTVFDVLRKDGETVYIHPDVDCRMAEIMGCSVIEENCYIEALTQIRNSILLPGTRITKAIYLENVIAGPGYLVNLKAPGFMLNRNGVLGICVSLLKAVYKTTPSISAISLVGAGGSDRKYYRIESHRGNSVLMKSSEADQDFHRHLDYTSFFRNHDIPVPEMYVSDKERFAALFEDLGDATLYSWLHCHREADRLENLYKRIIDVLATLHTTVSDRVSECPLLESRVFDYDYLRWETAYFMEQFVAGLKRIPVNNKGRLDKEFDRLAQTADSFPKVIVHRDFQSQNIMITAGDTPRLLDYQGARLGPAAYDLASILWDPYFRLSDTMRDAVLDYYCRQRVRSPETFFNEAAFRESIISCRLQRHMQSLGAYAFLSQAKGKNYFLKYIPAALRYLREETKLVQHDYPVLNELVRSLI